MIAVLVLCGCAHPKAQRGGVADATRGLVSQGENAATPTVQEWERIDRTLPVGPQMLNPIPEPGVVKGSPLSGKWSVFEIAPNQQREVWTRSRTELGAAQKDTSRELAAKFANMKPVQWIGIACLLGAGALFYFGWHTPAVIAAGTGVGLIVLSHSIVGNERLILILLAAAAAILGVLWAYHKGALDHLLHRTPVDSAESAEK